MLGQRQDAVPHLQVIDAIAQRRDDARRQLSRDEWTFRQELVLAADDQQVHEIGGCGLHVDHHFSRRRYRIGDVFHDQIFDGTKRTYDNGLHPATSWEWETCCVLNVPRPTARQARDAPRTSTSTRAI